MSTFSSWSIVSEEIDPESYLAKITKERAKDELGETGEVKDEKLREFRNLIIEKCIICPINDDKFLLRFLRVGKYSVNKAMLILTKYNRLLRQYHYMLSDISIEKMLPMLREFQFNETLKYRTNLGQIVTVIRAGKWDPKVFNLYEFFRMTMMTLEYLTISEITQINGIVCIIDWEGFTIDKLAYLRLDLAILLSKVFQGNYPARFQAIHMINHGFSFKVLFNIVSPFFPKKIIDRTHFHRNSLKSLHKHIEPTEILPVSLGGKAPDGETFQYLINDILNYDEYCQNLVKSSVAKTYEEINQIV